MSVTGDVGILNVISGMVLCANAMIVLFIDGVPSTSHLMPYSPSKSPSFNVTLTCPFTSVVAVAGVANE